MRSLAKIDRLAQGDEFDRRRSRCACTASRSPRGNRCRADRRSTRANRGISLPARRRRASRPVPASAATRWISSAPIVFRAPEFLHLAAEHAAVAQFHQFMKQRQGARLGERRQSGLPGGDIDRRAGQHQFAHLGGKARGIEQRQPAALTEPDQIDVPPSSIDQHVERGEIVVDAEIAHLHRRRRQSVTNSCRRPASRKADDQAVPGRQIGDGRAMQRKRRAKQRGDAVLGRAEIAQAARCSIRARSYSASPRPARVARDCRRRP